MQPPSSNVFIHVSKTRLISFHLIFLWVKISSYHPKLLNVRYVGLNLNIPSLLFSVLQNVFLALALFETQFGSSGNAFRSHQTLTVFFSSVLQFARCALCAIWKPANTVPSVMYKCTKPSHCSTLGENCAYHALCILLSCPRCYCYLFQGPYKFGSKSLVTPDGLNLTP